MEVNDFCPLPQIIIYVYVCYTHNSIQPTIAFAEPWTQKEAFLKLTGEGLVDNIPDVLRDVRIKKVSFETHTAQDKSYVYTVCRFRGM